MPGNCENMIGETLCCQHMVHICLATLLANTDKGRALSVFRRKDDIPCFSAQEGIT